jgi:hypothetical protein
VPIHRLPSLSSAMESMLLLLSEFSLSGLLRYALKEYPSYLLRPSCVPIHRKPYESSKRLVIFDCDKPLSMLKVSTWITLSPDIAAKGSNTTIIVANRILYSSLFVIKTNGLPIKILKDFCIESFLVAY